MIYTRGGQTFMLAGQFSTNKLHYGPQDFFIVFLSHVKPKIYGDLIKKHVNKIGFSLLNFAAGAAEYLWRAACGPWASVWPRLLYTIAAHTMAHN